MTYVSYINSKTQVTEERATISELIFQALGHTPPATHTQAYSKNFFEIRTISTDEPRRVPINIYTTSQDYIKDYHAFRIPKASGGTRLIEAPNDELKHLQARTVDILQNMYKILPHNAAYAYTKGRCAYDALVTHQRANAKWFLKVDIKDFFPSISKSVLKNKLPQIYPLNFLDEEDLDKLIEMATLRDVLPQGSPLSPMLSNLVMVGFDKELTQRLWRYNNTKFTYTRYADDMIITSPYEFNFQSILTLIEEVLSNQQLPFTLSRHKTRYASKAGRNWNLGLMYTQDQKITVGQKRKKEMHSLLNTFVVDAKNAELWDKSSTQELLGKLAYLKNVEPNYHQNMINKYQQKYDINIINLFSYILRD